jgi:hypothetical protein
VARYLRQIARRKLWVKCTTSAEWKLIYQPCSRLRAAWTLTWLIELEDELNHGPWLWLWLWLSCISSISFNVGFGMNLYLSNQVLIKFDQLKFLIAVSQSAFPWFWPSCHIISNTCWVPTISVLMLVIIAAQRRKWCEVFWDDAEF